MSQAHRPTWNPTQGRETKAGSQQISKLSAASHTKLKFRQPGQTSTTDVARRDLRAELLEAERVAAEKKRRAAGLPALPAPASSLRLEAGTGDEVAGEEEEDRAKRRKVLEEALEADKDEEDEYDEGLEDVGADVKDKGKGKASVVDADDDDDEEDDDE
jgi:protein CWC15